MIQVRLAVPSRAVFGLCVSALFLLAPATLQAGPVYSGMNGSEMPCPRTGGSSCNCSKGGGNSLSTQEIQNLREAALAGATPAGTGVIHVVEVKDIEFVPPDITIKVGDTVRWLWIDAFHSVTSRDTDPETGELLFDSQNVIDFTITTPGIVFDHTFNEVGVFDYFCIPHEFTVPPMIGVVRVLGDEPPEPVIPEPSALALLGLGCLALIGYRWRRRGRDASV
jgi:plastocyanin